MKKAVCLLSGGLDSTTSLAIAQNEGFEVYALSFRYGQRHLIELERAQAFALKRSVARHVTIDMDMRAFGGSALTADIPVPKHHDVQEIGSAIPIPSHPPAIAASVKDVTSGNREIEGVAAVLATAAGIYARRCGGGGDGGRVRGREGWDVGC